MKPLLTRIFFVCVLSFVIPLLAYSGENLQGAMRAQQQRQQLLQQQAVAQQVAQKRAAIVQQQQALYQQAVQQRQVMQQQRAREMQAYQQKVLQSQAYNKAYQQKTAEELARKQAIQQQAYAQAVQQRAGQQIAYAQSAQKQLLANQEALQAGAAQYSQPAYHPSPEAEQVSTNEVAQISDLDNIWKDLEISSEIWPMMLDREPRELTVKRYIEAYRKNGIFIRKPASGYVDIIDSMTSEPNAPMLKTPFKDVLKVAAIIEYDFDNGMDKDQMALKVLGEKSYESNKKRLGL